MEPKRALLASTIIAATVMTGAVAYAASSSLTDNNRDNVGQLHPTATQPPTITVIVDPATGAATAPSTLDAGSTAGTPSTNRRHEHDEEDDD